MELSDSKLKEVIEGCKRQDRIYQKQLYDLYYGKLMGVCLRYTKDKNTANDVLQNTFIKIFDKIQYFSFEGSIEGWLKRTTINTAIDHLRKKKNDPLLLDNEELFKGENEYSENEEDTEEFIQLKANEIINAMQELSDAYRTVFNLYVIEEYSHKEIADILNISQGTSKSNLAKAKKKLKQELKNDSPKKKK